MPDVIVRLLSLHVGVPTLPAFDDAFCTGEDSVDLFIGFGVDGPLFCEDVLSPLPSPVGSAFEEALVGEGFAATTATFGGLAELKKRPPPERDEK